MATYKVGDRVRKIARLDPKDIAAGWDVDSGGTGGALGSTGTVIDTGGSRYRLPPGCVGVLFDDGRSSHPTGAYAMHVYQIAPLTDPKADEFIERMKKLGREPAPILEDVTSSVKEGE